MKQQRLPTELRSLVKQSVFELGEILRHRIGQRGFQFIENLRRSMTDFRNIDESERVKRLRHTFRRLEKCSVQQRRDVAHAFTLMLETMNACEQAYRTERLKSQECGRIFTDNSCITYVFTAHPTEARSPDNLFVFQKIQLALQKALCESFEAHKNEVRSLLEVAWTIHAMRARQPKVEDEIIHVHGITLRPEILDALIDLNQQLGKVMFRSWVGGDKDGHPYVNEVTLRESLTDSRARLFAYARQLIQDASRIFELMKDDALLKQVRQLKVSLAPLGQLKTADGRHIHTLHKTLKKTETTCIKAQVTFPVPLQDLKVLLELFPALVLPLEMRESSDEILKRNPVLLRMLKVVASLSRGADPRWYVRGVIISHTQEADDLMRTANLIKEIFGSFALPVIPLFEDRTSLNISAEIMSECLQTPSFLRAAQTLWRGRLEVMVGYSDSAKESGVLSSRIEIGHAIQKLDRMIRKFELTPVFFHGSGGSVDRGGGSVEEQTNWLPKSSLQNYKSTVQGEMIARILTSPEVFENGLARIFQQSRTSRLKSGSIDRSMDCEVLDEFAARVGEIYSATVKDPDFLEMTRLATPYSYLNLLRIGSRPTKRKKEFSLASLRAIPWVLCWTQTRVLFPTWWGIGTAWSELTLEHRKAIRRECQRHPIAVSYIKALGFTLSKVELSVWNLYLEKSALSDQQVRHWVGQFNKEFEATKKFMRFVSGEKSLLWFRPWLDESIRLRSPMIHPLNLLQLIAIESQDAELLRETVTGIASGMMTTG